MRFSIVAGPRQRPDLGQTAAEAWWNFADDAVFAEQHGFDAAYSGEHHFVFSSGNSSPLTLLAAIAQRTSTLRLGTSVICAPFHNPLRLAEDIAAVDIASNGRFDLGIGVGSEWIEFQAWHIDPKERVGRTWEIVDIIEKCLYSGYEKFSWEGKYYQFPEIQWIFHPVQDRIPIFWGGAGPKNSRRAAERGFNLIAPDFSGEYTKALEEQGKNPRDFLIGFTDTVTIAPTREEAMESMVEPWTWVSNQYGSRQLLDGSWPGTPPITGDDFVRAVNGEQVGFGTPIPGTVDEIIEHFLPIARGEGPHGLITHIGIEPRQPGTSTESARRTIQLFGDEIIPVLRKEAEAHGL